jgi:xanthine dehydrogenase small subunit
LNGRLVSIDGVSTQTTLLDFIRSQGLTGAKEGCAEGECGACTVALVCDTPDGTAYQPVNSCLMFVPMAAGREVYTVESLKGRGELAPAQEALAAAGGSQCGYCTPGFVMSLFAEQYRPGRVGPCGPYSMSGNLCRCTGYRPIRDAALSLGPPPPGEFLDRLSRPAPPIDPLEYANEADRFSRPASVEECLALMAADPSARLIAGGTDLGVESNLQLRRWQHLISVEAIPELHEFSDTAERVKIGAALPLTEIAARWSAAPNVFPEWLPLFASLPICNRATLAGNLATASPIGDGAPLLMALDAEVHIAGPNGRRTIPLAQFFTGYRRTALKAGELLAAIEIPKPFPSTVAFYKIAKRTMDDISTVAACMALERDHAGRITRARFAFGGVAAVPVRVFAAEEAVLGRRWNRDAVQRVQEILDGVLKPISDHRGSAEYRLAVAKSLVEKFWWEREAVAA